MNTCGRTAGKETWRHRKHSHETLACSNDNLMDPIQTKSFGRGCALVDNAHCVMECLNRFTCDSLEDI